MLKFVIANTAGTNAGILISHAPDHEREIGSRYSDSGNAAPE
jgi:hypothetical protein